MFSKKFSRIIKISDLDPSSVMKMEAFFEEKKNANRLNKIKLSPEKIQLISGMTSTSDVFNFIKYMIDSDILKRVIIIKSSEGVSLGEYSSYDDLPDFIYDRYIDMQVEVNSNNIDIIYIPGDSDNDK